MKLISKYETGWAAPDNLFDMKTEEWRYQRPLRDREKCCLCGWCYLYCPTGCIHLVKGRLIVNLEYCKGCGLCAGECPVNAIVMIREEVK
jgi:pyruvate ferredoxin oxidoreductase delta subunit